MNWWGKVLGGAFGYMLGGPIGALLGAALGHQLDKGINIDFSAAGEHRADESVELAQTAFFTATFSILGHIAKADGRVTKEEIAYAESVMQQMDLDSDQRKTAIWLFREGKKPDFKPDEIIEQFRKQLGRRRNLMRLFMEIQIQAAYEDGILHKSEEQILLSISRALGISEREFRTIEFMIQAAGHFNGQDSSYRHSSRRGSRQQAGRRSSRSELEDAYKVLGVDSSASDNEVKKAYRRLLSQHHPDKLVSRGLPEEMMKIAAEKTHQIKQAYEVIRKTRPALK